MIELRSRIKSVYYATYLDKILEQKMAAGSHLNAVSGILYCTSIV